MRLLVLTFLLTVFATSAVWNSFNNQEIIYESREHFIDSIKYK